jgi:hypothetical protein
MTSMDLKKMIQKVARVEGTSDQFALRDILTDLRHVCDDMGLDFDMAVEGSEEVHALEVAERV